MTELAGISSDRVSSMGWALSSMLAGMAGVLLGPLFPQLAAQNFFLLIVAAIAAAAFAGLSSLPLALDRRPRARHRLRHPGARAADQQHPRPGPAAVAAVRRAVLRADPEAVAPAPPGVHRPARRGRSAAARARGDRARHGSAAGDARLRGPVVRRRSSSGSRTSATRTGCRSRPRPSSSRSSSCRSPSSPAWRARSRSPTARSPAIGAFTVRPARVARGASRSSSASSSGIAIAAVVGALLAIPALRLGGIYLALATLAFALFFESVIVKFDWAGGGLLPVEVPRPILGGVDFTSDRPFFYLCIALLAAAGVVRRADAARLHRTVTARVVGQRARRLVGRHQPGPGAHHRVRSCRPALRGLRRVAAGDARGRGQLQRRLHRAVRAVLARAGRHDLAPHGRRRHPRRGSRSTFFPELLKDLGVSQSWQYILFGLGAYAYARHPEGTFEHFKRTSQNFLQQLLDRSGSQREQLQPADSTPASMAAPVASTTGGVVERAHDQPGAARRSGRRTTIRSRWRTEGRSRMSEPRRPLLVAENITVRFAGITALSEVGLTVGEREIVGLIGPNGAGKTTFFNCLSGALRPERRHGALRGPVDQRPPDAQARATRHRSDLPAHRALLGHDRARAPRGGRARPRPQRRVVEGHPRHRRTRRGREGARRRHARAARPQRRRGASDRGAQPRSRKVGRGRTRAHDRAAALAARRAVVGTRSQRDTRARRRRCGRCTPRRARRCCSSSTTSTW